MVRRSLEYHIIVARRHDECSPNAMYRRASSYDNVMLVLGEGKDNFYAYRLVLAQGAFCCFSFHLHC